MDGRWWMLDGGLALYVRVYVCAGRVRGVCTLVDVCSRRDMCLCLCLCLCVSVCLSACMYVCMYESYEYRAGKARQGKAGRYYVSDASQHERIQLD